jgi:hypothetical protein
MAFELTCEFSTADKNFLQAGGKIVLPAGHEFTLPAELSKYGTFVFDFQLDGSCDLSFDPATNQWFRLRCQIVDAFLAKIAAEPERISSVEGIVYPYSKTALVHALNKFYYLALALECKSPDSMRPMQPVCMLTMILNAVRNDTDRDTVALAREAVLRILNTHSCVTETHSFYSIIWRLIS